MPSRTGKAKVKRTDLAAELSTRMGDKYTQEQIQEILAAADTLGSDGPPIGTVKRHPRQHVVAVRCTEPEGVAPVWQMVGDNGQHWFNRTPMLNDEWELLYSPNSEGAQEE